LIESTDGTSVYVASADSSRTTGGIGIFTRNRKTGALRKTGCIGEKGCAPARGVFDSVNKVALGPDGRTL
jgi:hypothetical protein